jgi:hypothetical protein
VEARVGAAERGGVGGRVLDRAHRGAQHLELGRRAARRGQRRRLARDRAPPVRERAELLGGRGVERGRRRVGRDERAPGPPPADLEQPRVLEHGERLAQRHARDAERLGELDLPGQPLAWREQAGADRLADAAHDLLDGAGGLDARQQEVAGDGGGGPGHEKG